MQVSENVSPSNREINPRPAIAAVQDLFMDHVMKRAPGYPKLLKLVSDPIVPTPVGVANILKAGSSALGIGAMLVDMGGATTDIFSVSNGNMERTVAANIGMSFSMTPIRIESPLAATVVSTASCRAVSLVSSGLKLSGVLGFGKTVRGTLHTLADSSTHDIAFVSNSADSATLSLAAEKGVAGLICPSIAADTLVSWLGREPGIFITGQEKTPFSLMILGGIGSAGVDAHVLDSLSPAWGNHSALFPETKIRAGIHRPFLAISSG